jgi:UrcA family protein
MNMKSFVAATALVAAFGLAAVAGPVSAQAAPGGEISIKVQTGDIDLSKPAGAAVMLQRIHNAASKICGPAPTDWLHFGAQYKACLKETSDRAVARLDSPMVTAMNGGAPSSVRVAEASDPR